MRKILNFIVYKWNSLLLSFATLWMASVYMNDGLYLVAIVSMLFALFKIVGLLTDNTALRIIGLVGMNITWSVTSYLMFSCFTLHEWQYPAIIALFGIGISLQERFYER